MIAFFFAPSPGPNRSPDRWWRRLFIEDWSLKLLALAITLVLWFVVSGQRTSVRRQLVDVQLTFRTLPDMEISESPVDKVAITVSGPSREVDQVNARDLVAVVDVTDRKPGERVVQLTSGHVQMERLPSGVKLDSVEPNSLVVKVEARVERELVVEPRVQGNPAATFELKEVVATPNKVRVRGPASHVNALQKAFTEAISIEGRRESFQIPRAAIYVADPKVDVLDTTSVHVEIIPSGTPKLKSRDLN